MTTVGLTRWDGLLASQLTGSPVPRGIGGREILALNSDAAYASDVPFFATGTSPTMAVADSQAVADAQLQMARACGVGYFAYLFDGYVPDDWTVGRGTDYQGTNTGGNKPTFAGLNTGWKRHLASAAKTAVKACLILQGDQFTFTDPVPGSPASEFTDMGVVIAAQMATMQPAYMTVTISSVVRPLIFFLSVQTFATAFGSNGAAITALAGLRAQVIAAGFNDPFIVSLDGAAALTNTLGLNGASHYFWGATGSADQQAYSVLTGLVSTEWATMLAAQSGSIQVIPHVMSGLDWSARVTAQTYAPGEAATARSYVLATSAQLVAHVQAAIDFRAAHPSNCLADTVLCYTWNEHTEGRSTFCPTRRDKGANLQALGKQLGKQRESPRALRAAGLALASH